MFPPTMRAASTKSMPPPVDMAPQLPSPAAMMPARTVKMYVTMTSGVPIISARGMTRCGFWISPASVDIDS